MIFLDYVFVDNAMTNTQPPPHVYFGEPGRVPALHGLRWFADAGRIVAARPGVWLGAFFLAVALHFIIVDLERTVIPHTALARIGPTLLMMSDACVIAGMSILWPALAFGVALMAHRQAIGGRPRLRDLWREFASSLSGRLPLIRCAFLTLPSLAICWLGIRYFKHVPAVLFSFHHHFEYHVTHQVEYLINTTVAWRWGYALVLAGVPLAFLTFALAVIVLTKRDLWGALGESFLSGAKNCAAVLVNALVIAVLCVIGITIWSLIIVIIEHLAWVVVRSGMKGIFSLLFHGTLLAFSLVHTWILFTVALVSYAAARDIFAEAETAAAPS